MDAEAGIDNSNSDDIQAKVLQTTLAEIKTSPDSPECCVICFDSISEPCAALPCTHSNFDFVCLVSWLQEHPNCPLCKANVYKVRYSDVQNGESFYRVPNSSKAGDSTTSDERPADHDRQTYTNSGPRRRFTSQNGILLDTGRRHARRRAIPPSPPTQDEAIQRRRHIYRHNLYSLHIGSNRHSRYRPPPTPAQLSSTPHLLTRARLWLRRELQVFSFLSDPSPTPNNNNDPTHNRRASNAEFLLEYIIAILKTVDIQGSAGAGQAESLLADFLGRREHARLFLHELCCWLRSPAQSLAAWDREVQYPEPGARRVVDGEEREDVDGDGERGRGVSWRDPAGGDHWRAGSGDGDERTRKRRRERGEDESEGEGRVSQLKKERYGRR